MQVCPPRAVRAYAVTSPGALGEDKEEGVLCGNSVRLRQAPSRHPDPSQCAATSGLLRGARD